MENTHQQNAVGLQVLDGQKFDFNAVWKNFLMTLMPALEMFKKNAANLLLVYGIPVVASGLLVALILPMFLAGIPLMGMVVALVAVVLNLVAYLALIKAVSEIHKGHKVELAKVYQLAAKNIVGAIILSFKVLFSLAGGIKKFLNSLLAVIYFMDSESPNVDSALKMSQENCEGKSITVVWNFVLIAVAINIATSIITSIWVSITLGISYSLASFGTYVASLMLTFGVVFHYTLKNQIEKLKSGHSN